MSDHKINLDQLAKGRNGHSVFSPSASSMWLNCLGSLIPNLLAEDDSGEEAARGTVAHAVAEEWLKSGVRPDHRLGQFETIRNGGTEFEIEIDEMMFEFVERYVLSCQAVPGDHFIEVRVDLSKWMPIPNQGGTADFVSCCIDSGTLYVRDLKYGVNVEVFIEDNSQLLLYALGVYEMFDWLYNFKRIRMAIWQPRRGGFKEVEVSVDELLAFGEYVKERAAGAWQLDAPRSPGAKQCQWCRVTATCGAWAVWIEQQMADLSDGAFTDPDINTDDILALKERLDDDFGGYLENIAPLAQLSVEQMQVIYKMRGRIVRWLDDIGKYLLEQLNQNVDLDQFKLVSGKKSRYFSNEAKAKRELLDAQNEKFPDLELEPQDVAPPTLVSPAGAEALLVKKLKFKKKDAEDFVNRFAMSVAGKPTMVPKSDPRPALRDLSDGAFDDPDAL